MNCWRFHAEIFTACRQIEPSARGELEITDAAQYLIGRLSVVFRVIRAEGAVLDMATREDVASVRKQLAGTSVHL